MCFRNSKNSELRYNFNLYEEPKFDFFAGNSHSRYFLASPKSTVSYFKCPGARFELAVVDTIEADMLFICCYPHI